MLEGDSTAYDSLLELENASRRGCLEPKVGMQGVLRINPLETQTVSVCRHCNFSVPLTALYNDTSIFSIFPFARWTSFAGRLS